MRIGPHRNSIPFALPLAAAIMLATLSAGMAQTPPLEQLISAVVHIKTFINPDGRTLRNLGREREGSGIVIDGNGLVLTIGYLMVEAHTAEIITNDGRTLPANVIGYDNDTGFGLLQAISPLKIKPLALGKSADVKERDAVVVASFGGPEHAARALVVAKREFAGYWEYMLDEAIFTSPPHPQWSGAALISREGKLVGVGSLVVPDATGQHDNIPGNMFVPIDRLPPILGDLIADGRAAGPARPWLGISTMEVHGRLIVSRVTPESPAERAGVQRGDIILGVNGQEPASLADFYRKIWAVGAAGATVPLDVMQDNERRHIDVKSMNRLDHLKLKSTF
jgi:S1-C subfamily serine protease